MRAFLIVVSEVLSLYSWILIAAAILSWLIAFNVVNTRSPAVNMISDVLYRLTEPLLAPIRRFVPFIGGIDLSFLVLWFLIRFLQILILQLIVASPF